MRHSFSRFQNRFQNFSCLAGRALCGVFLALGLMHCELHKPQSPDGPASNVPANSLELQVYASSFEGGLAKTLEADSLVFVVTGADFPAKRYVFGRYSPKIALTELSPGKSRHLLAQAYRKHRVICEGQIRFDMDSTRRNDFDLVLRPTFARLRAQLLLSALEFPVRTGSMTVTADADTFVGTWRQLGTLAQLTADTLPKGDHYRVSVVLRDSLGRLRYSSQKDGVVLNPGLEATVEMTLVPTEVTAQVGLAVAEPLETQLHLGLPAGRRAPLRPGELQITEAYPIPSSQDSGSEGEWLEITNAAGDSLHLSGCRLSRDKLGGDTRSLLLDSLGALPPGKVMTLGRSKSGAQFPYPSFSLVNTAATLWLTCQGDSLVLDTLRYDGSSRSEGAVAVREGQVLTRKPSTLGMVSRPEDWCLTLLKPEGDEEGATPGTLFPACGDQ